MTFKPMLAARCENLAAVRMPVAVSPKLDGVRAIVRNGVVVSRSLKPIPNPTVQAMFRHLEGYDGELIVGSPVAPDVFRSTTSGVMSQTGDPDVAFWVFDRVTEISIPWWQRFPSISADPNVRIVPQIKCHSRWEVEQQEEMMLMQGFEGLMIRDLNAPYKFGRSTEREGYLLKLKRFLDSEAEVLGMEERLRNENAPTVNALGHTERSGHQANLVPSGTMGALIVRDLKTDVVFKIGTGFDDDQRARWWAMGDSAIGRIVKYSYFPTGSKDKPRFPVYLGERSKLDL